MTPLGTLMWTASSAGWTVLAYLTGIPEAAVTALSCGLMAIIWHYLQKI